MNALLVVLIVYMAGFVVGLWCDLRWPQLRPMSGWRVLFAVVFTVWGLALLPTLGYDIGGTFWALMFLLAQDILIAWSVLWLMRWLQARLQP